MRVRFDRSLVGHALAHSAKLLTTVEKFVLSTLAHYFALAAYEDPLLTSEILTALNFTCSRLVTRHSRLDVLRPPPLFPLSRSLSATLITHFEGPDDFVRQALSPYDPSDLAKVFPRVVTINSDSIHPPIYGTLLMKIIKTVAAQDVKPPKVKFVLRLVKVDEGVRYLIIDGCSELLSLIVDLVDSYIFEEARPESGAKAFHICYLNTNHWEKTTLNPINKVALGAVMTAREEQGLKQAPAFF